MSLDFSDPRVIEHVNRLPAAEQRRVLELLEERERLNRIQLARTDFLTFVKAVWPDFIPGAHHKLMAEKFNLVAEGKLQRLIINMPPRFTKSELTSWLLVSWFLGLFPKKKIIQASANEKLAAGFGRKVRNLVGREDDGVEVFGPDVYHEIFPTVRIASDSKAAGLWHTNHGGVYFAAGTDTMVTGRGGDIVIIDDPHTEQDAKNAIGRPEVYDEVYEWYKSGPRQRLQPGGAILLIMTRWSKRDLSGRLLAKMKEDEDAGLKVYDKWDVLELPAILDEGLITERSMWPQFWPLETLQATRNSLDTPKWQAQYQQKPTASEGAILKKERWKRWKSETIPACDFVIQSWDTATTKSNRADFSAMTTWGVFQREDPNTGKKIANLILLDAYKARLEFPRLKLEVRRRYVDEEPDMLLIENKSSGIGLIQELRAMGLPVEDYSYGRGKKKGDNDKIARANAISDIFASGFVWAPERKFADDVIEELAEFPNGEHDDYVDSVVQALLRFRAGGLISTMNDAEDEPEEPRVVQRRRYY